MEYLISDNSLNTLSRDVQVRSNLVQAHLFVPPYPLLDALADSRYVDGPGSTWLTKRLKMPSLPVLGYNLPYGPVVDVGATRNLRESQFFVRKVRDGSSMG
ncbi:unnamed protein product [Nippostrongylus brasiliensis]|uniref:COesterase domain-containing protein n=1 Tax=Nippostrongylus brasiliensis TaxID=27835 RepID=A0A0N4Y626_NIPBR|nr:unnamed protein product [Nippostrongylus brasiliensis]